MYLQAAYLEVRATTVSFHTQHCLHTRHIAALPAHRPTNQPTNHPSRAQELPCGHLLHSRCFAEYTRYNYTCPLCSKCVLLPIACSHTPFPAAMQPPQLWSAPCVCCDGRMARAPACPAGFVLWAFVCSCRASTAAFPRQAPFHQVSHPSKSV